MKKKKHVEEVDDDSDEGPQIACSTRRHVLSVGQGLGKGLGAATPSSANQNSATKKQASTQTSSPTVQADGSDSDEPPPLVSDEDSDDSDGPPPLTEDDDDEDGPPPLMDGDSSSSGAAAPDSEASGQWGWRARHMHDCMPLHAWLGHTGRCLPCMAACMAIQARPGKSWHRCSSGIATG